MIWVIQNNAIMEILLIASETFFLHTWLNTHSAEKQPEKLTVMGSWWCLVSLSCSRPLVHRPSLGHVLSAGRQQASVCESSLGEWREFEPLSARRANSVWTLQTASQLFLSSQAGQAGPWFSPQQKEKVQYRGSSSLRARRPALTESRVWWGAPPAGKFHPAPLPHLLHDTSFKHSYGGQICISEYVCPSSAALSRFTNRSFSSEQFAGWLNMMKYHSFNSTLGV